MHLLRGLFSKYRKVIFLLLGLLLLIIVGYIIFSYYKNIANGNYSPFTYSFFSNNYKYSEDGVSYTIGQPGKKHTFEISRGDASAVFSLNSLKTTSNKRFSNLISSSDIKNGVLSYQLSSDNRVDVSFYKDKYSQGINDTIILSSNSDQTKYEYKLDLNNISSYKKVDERWHFYDSENNDVFHIAKGTMTDSNGEQSSNVIVEIKKNDNEQDIVTVYADPNWLKSDNRAYPVALTTSIIVDPLIDTIVERSRQTNTKFLGRSENGGLKFAATSELGPVNFQDENGNWKEYNTTLKESSNPDYDFEVTDADYKVFINRSISQTPALRMEKDGLFFTINPGILQYVNERGDTQLISNPSHQPNGVVDENTITYAKLYGEGIDLRFTFSATGIQKELIISSQNNLPQPSIVSPNLDLNIEYSYSDSLEAAYHDRITSQDTAKKVWTESDIQPKGTVDFRDSNPQKKDRNYDGIVDEEDNVVFQMMPAQAYDSSENQRIISSDADELILIHQKNNGNHLASIQTPYTWLMDTQYPVTIDPSIGPRNPGTMSDRDPGAGIFNPWSNINNAMTSNNVYATRAIAGSANGLGQPQNFTNQLRATNFGFNLPDTTSSIDGIQPSFERKASVASRVHTEFVGLLRNNSIYVQNHTGYAKWGTSDAYETHWGPTNTGGKTWTYSDINSTGFGLMIQARNYSTNTSNVTAYVDHMRMTVYYTANTPPSINYGPIVSYGSYNRLGPNNTPITVSFRAIDAEQTASNALSYQIRTSSVQGGGTLISSGTTTNGTIKNQSLTNTSPGLVNGSQTSYIRVYDGSSWSNAYSLNILVDRTPPTTNNISYTPSPVTATKQYRVSFTPSDTYSTNSNELSWWIHTAPNGSGTQLAAGQATSGNTVTTSVFTDTALVNGNNARYLRIRDGANNIYETSFSVSVNTAVCGNNICETGEDLTCPQDCVEPTYSISATVFNDLNENQVWNTGESGVNNIGVRLERYISGSYSLVATQNSTGGTQNLPAQVAFTELEAGTYRLTLDTATIPGNFTASITQHVVTLTNTNQTRNFGLREIPSETVTFTGRLLDNPAGDCSQAGTGITGATVRINTGSEPPWTSNPTDTDGRFSIQVTGNPNADYYMTISDIGDRTVKCVQVNGTEQSHIGLTFGPFNLNDNPEIVFVLNTTSPWFMTEIGSVRTPTVRNNVPSGLLPSSSGNTASVFYSTVGSALFGGASTSPNIWKVDQEYYHITQANREGRASYSYYMRKANDNEISLRSLTGCESAGACTYSGNPNNLDNKSVYFIDGNLIFDPSQEFIAPGKTVVFLVNGDIIFNKGLTLRKDTSLVIFAAKNDIIISPQVGTTNLSQTPTVTSSSSSFNIQAILTAENDIIIESNATCPNTPDRRLNIEGTLVANADNPFGVDNNGGKLKMERTLCVSNSNYPALYVKSRLSFIFELTDFYRYPNRFWVESAP